MARHLTRPDTKYSVKLQHQLVVLLAQMDQLERLGRLRLVVVHQQVALVELQLLLEVYRLGKQAELVGMELIVQELRLL
jgi:hypothetical protein